MARREMTKNEAQSALTARNYELGHDPRLRETSVLTVSGLCCLVCVLLLTQRVLDREQQTIDRPRTRAPPAGGYRANAANTEPRGVRGLASELEG